MPIQIRRFGVGQRRRAGPPGSTGVSGQVIHSDARGTVAELAFTRDGRIEPHANPNTTWFIVIEGGGWVVVDDERLRVAAGEAVLWPAGVPHAAWADHGPMRAFVVEFAGPDDGAIRGIIEGRVRELTAGGSRAARADGALTSPRRRAARQTSEGEPD
jgi:quercetin dioxygenase-like cupin family protein